MNNTILIWINQGWAHPWADMLFDFLSSKREFSFPLFGLLAIFFGVKFGKDGWKFAALLLGLILLSDSIGSIIKALTLDPRPCLAMHPYLRDWQNLHFPPCGQSDNGMPSNHALNFFALAAFLGAIFKDWRWIAIMTVIASLVALSRIYLGAHFPDQVLAGALIGLILGMLGARISLRKLHFVKRLQQQAGYS